MCENKKQQDRQGKARNRKWPCAGAARGMHLQQPEPRRTEQDNCNGEQVEKQCPGEASISALVQVVEIGDRAATGFFEHDFAGLTVNADPGISTGPGQGDIRVKIGPFDRAACCIKARLRFEIGRDLGGQDGLGASLRMFIK